VVIVRGEATLEEVLPWSKARSIAFTNPIYLRLRTAPTDGGSDAGAEPAADSRP